MNRRELLEFTRYTLSDDGHILSELAEYEPDDTLAEQRRAESYAKDIRGIARAVWQSLPIDAYPMMWDVVALGISTAWQQGAASCGISEGELTLDERIRRDIIINEQRNYIIGFIDWVYEHRRDGPDKLPLASIIARANTWQKGYLEAYNLAKMMACGNQKLMWMREVLRSVKQGCNDCLNYDGRVYRASTWHRYDIRPQHPGLGCHGFGACGFVVTDEKCNPGRPPGMTGK